MSIPKRATGIVIQPANGPKFIALAFMFFALVAGAVLVILVWILTGPTFHFSDTWQLIINTATTIITFLMVFLIQNTQNRDAKAVHLKLDEMIRALKGARNQLVDLEDLSDEDLKKLEEQFQRLRKKAEHDGTHPRKIDSPASR